MRLIQTQGRTSLWALCSLLILSMCTSCSDDLLLQSEELTPDKTVTVQAYMANTKMAYASDTGKNLIWTAGDAFQFYNDSEAGATFTLTSGAGTSNGTFTGTNSAGMNRAIYPASATNQNGQTGYHALMLPFYGQTQIGNNTNSQLGQFNYMMAELPSGMTSTLNFQLLPAQLRLELLLPASVVGNITKVELLLPPGKDLFISELCPSDATKNVMTHRQSLALSDVILGTDRKLTASMMIAPMELNGEELTIAVTTDDSTLDYYYTELHNYNMNFEAGHQYAGSFALQAVDEYYPSSSYTLSSDGKELTQWNVFTPNNQTIDMNKDIHLRRVETLGSYAFGHKSSGGSYYSTNYQWIQLPDGLTRIKPYCFLFAYGADTSQKIALGVGPHASNITGICLYNSFASWHVSNDNTQLADLEDHLVDKTKHVLKAISLPLSAASTMRLPNEIDTYDSGSISTGKNIKRFEVSSQVHSIANYAFYYCGNGITELVIPQSNASTISVSASSFSDDMKSDTKLIVPTGSKSQYEAHAVWGLFNTANIEEAAMFNFEIPESARTPHMITRSGDTYTVDYESYSVATTLLKDMSWKNASSNASWITLSSTSGSNATGPTLHISGNASNEWRYAQVTVEDADGNSKVITIKQQPTTYVLPVVIHVLQDGSGKTEGITTAMGQALVDSLNNRCAHMPMYFDNGLYDAEFESSLRFTLATEDPDGNATTGVQFHTVATAQRNSSDFLNFDYPLSAQDEADQAMVWPQNRYINLFIFDFVDKDGNDTGVVGTSVLCMIRPDINAQYLGYFNTVPYGTDYNNINSMFSVTLSSKQLYDDGDTPKITHSFVDTTVHELGHYLGLFHVFDDGPGPDGDDAVADTYNYDREKYSTYLTDFYTNVGLFNDGDRTVWADYAAAFEGQRLIGFRIQKGDATPYSLTTMPVGAYASTNIMDYYRFSTERLGFSPNQVQRMRYGIAHSPLIPHNDSYTRAAVNLPFDPHPDVKVAIID